MKKKNHLVALFTIRVKKLVENHLHLYINDIGLLPLMIVDVEFYACTTYIPMMILLPTRYSIVWLLSWLPNILYRRLDHSLSFSFTFKKLEGVRSEKVIFVAPLGISGLEFGC